MTRATDSLPPSRVPIDLAELRAQTAGDAGLEREVLALFVRKSAGDLDRIATAPTPAARREAAHGLVGSALAIGAHAVVAAARAIERDPATPVAELRAAVAAAHAFIRDRGGG